MNVIKIISKVVLMIVLILMSQSCSEYNVIEETPAGYHITL